MKSIITLSTLMLLCASGIYYSGCDDDKAAESCEEPVTPMLEPDADVVEPADVDLNEEEIAEEEPEPTAEPVAEPEGEPEGDTEEEEGDVEEEDEDTDS